MVRTLYQIDRRLLQARGVLRFGRAGPLVVRSGWERLANGLGIPCGGFHAFRHRNLTIMDRVSVPTKVRQDRLGHADIETTNRYTHVVSEDDTRAAPEAE